MGRVCCVRRQLGVKWRAEAARVSVCVCGAGAGGCARV